MLQTHHNFTPTSGVELFLESSKSYWKVRANVDILIVCHVAAQCIEIVMFDPERNLEANRLYLNSVLLAGKVDQKELQTKLTEKKESYTRQKKLFCAAQVTKELLMHAMVGYIQIRLQIVTLTDREFVITLANMSEADIVMPNGQLDVVFPEKPISVTPLECHFAKKFKSADITLTLNRLKCEEQALKSATKLAELATSSVDGFKLVMEEKIRLERELRARYSPARWRWIRAINRVLVQNFAKIVRKRVIAMGIYTEPDEEEKDEVRDCAPIAPPPTTVPHPNQSPATDQQRKGMRRLSVQPITIPPASSSVVPVNTASSASLATAASNTSAVTTTTTTTTGRKTIRRTIDNSLLSTVSSESPRANAAGQALILKTQSASPTHAATSGTTASGGTVLPAITKTYNAGHHHSTGIASKSTSTKRRDRAHSNVNVIRVRRSLNNEMFGTMLVNTSHLSAKEKPPTPRTMAAIDSNADAVPTLLQSYNVISQKKEPLTPVIMFYDSGSHE